jgi:hypothetical protein
MPDDRENLDPIEIDSDEEGKESHEKGKLKLPPHEAVRTNRGNITRTLRKPPFRVATRASDITSQHSLRSSKMAPRSAVRGNFADSIEETEEGADDGTRKGGRGRSGRWRGRH